MHIVLKYLINKTDPRIERANRFCLSRVTLTPEFVMRRLSLFAVVSILIFKCNRKSLFGLLDYEQCDCIELTCQVLKENQRNHSFYITLRYLPI